MHTDQAINIFLSGELGAPSAENRSERRAAAGLAVLHSDDAWNLERRVADEFVVRGQPPAAALAAVADYQPVPSHRITLIDRPPNDHAAYLAAGYRCIATEALMVRSVANLPPRDGRYTVEDASTSAQLAWLNAHDPAGRSWITPTRLREPRLRHVFIALDQRPVARGRIYRVDEGHSYTTHLYTAKDYRRRGLAQALMAQVLHDAAAHGEQWSVLVSSEAGLPLYQALGYEHRARLVVFEPDGL
ncbi:MAG TPA: GNAT family N-acetyltransferase [Herpetosiphonaceae bacterium]|nr:GNAT family N-acetyltransferase [Herpetosiphonaceae bacterium]